MKWAVFILVFACIPSLLPAQMSASVYFQRLSFPAGEVCTDEDLSIYFSQLGKVQSELSSDIAEREKAVNDYMKEHKQDMKQQMLQNANLQLTPEQMAVMKKENKHLSKEKKMEYADQIMQQNMNVSMKEIMEMKEYSKGKDTAAIKRYSQAYATERMADQEADPAVVEAGRLKMKSQFDVSKQLFDINQRLTGGGSKYTQLLDSLQVESDSAWSKLQNQIDPFNDEINAIYEMRDKDEGRRNDENASKKDFEQIQMLMKQIQELKYQYCFELTPRYIIILKELSQYLPTTFNDCDSVDYLNSEIIFRQTGVRPPKEALGISALKAVDHFASLLADCRKYKLVQDPNKQDSPTIE